MVTAGFLLFLHLSPSLAHQLWCKQTDDDFRNGKKDLLPGQVSQPVGISAIRGCSRNHKAEMPVVPADMSTALKAWG